MRYLRSPWRAAVAVGVALFACRTPYRSIALAPSLGPVDVARPMVLYERVQGHGCGDAAVLNALQDLHRVQADGFVEVVLEERETSDGPCATVTARPFTWCRRRALGINPDRQAGAGVTDIPARDHACDAPPPDPCDVDCGRFAEALHAGATETAMARNTCRQRCDDSGFMTCARAATTPEAVRACIDRPLTP